MSLARLKVKVFRLLGEVYCCEDLTTYHAASIKQLMDRMRDIQAVRELPSILLSLKNNLRENSGVYECFFSQSYRQFVQQADECLAACQAYVVQTRSQQVSYAEAEQNISVTILEGIRKAIVNQLAGGGFELGYGGSRHAIRQGASFVQVPKRIADIMKIIEGNSRTPDEKLNEIKAIKVAALSYRSSFLLFFGRTQSSTNQFITNLNCG
ncbi:hypothetical protein AVI51_09815 [Piscirickettsia salmonis]|uniref:Uncharacterized protein n=1 Tax=Piscirickettsia salmonis TaxID=1238 RepID=A0A9Q5VF41_PISSA|nr:hypothetical protein [Piscirickettsia salmonis]ALA23641.1 hypothetical protein KW89_170 [Piscirickettsia salmonis]APS44082.1 hypothetical protein AVI48_06705 [Piscirickettsia salmonis]APS47443.1 hypothetical protein AVI49_07315 [Piscirickettsia salmonis]APS51121.1 hypothetical protein AVI50_09910 [Piscirickettsia salmonis]APS54330.1 hypothetical protein AVI51_09815 [Piscirickettsia salmonis]